jgi:uncharacterized protein YbbC (DUF1343 family)
MLLAPFAAEAQQLGGGRVYSGLEVFLAHYSKLVAGKRVGLATNHTAVDFQRRHIADIFKADKRIDLVCLFAPEHGIRGDIEAGKEVPDMKDPRTGLPVYTLYGKNGHRPTKKQLETIDVMLFDMQDVGSRAYTYVWHMAELMSACAEAGKTMIVLDRPNPLGGETVDGPVTEKQYLSFIGLYPVPRVYGMTMGEMACYLNKEEGINCNLVVIPMANYKRGMSFKETGLPWIPPSPNIPNPDSACCFAATGTLGELGTMNIAIGTPLSFQTVSAPWMNAQTAAEELNALKLPGVKFVPVVGGVKKLKGDGVIDLNGVQMQLVSPRLFKPATTELAVMCYLKSRYPAKFHCLPEKEKGFDKAMGTSDVRLSVMKGQPWSAIAARWTPALEDFKAKRLKYLMKDYGPAQAAQ